MYITLTFVIAGLFLIFGALLYAMSQDPKTKQDEETKKIQIGALVSIVIGVLLAIASFMMKKNIKLLPGGLPWITFTKRMNPEVLAAMDRRGSVSSRI